MKTLLIIAFAFAFAAPLHAVTFADWVASYALTGDDAAPDADPDHDGLANLLEYALEDLNPTVANTHTHPSLPRLAFVRRTGTRIGAWEFASFTVPPSNGVGGVRHAALIYTVRPDVEGIRFVPQLSDQSTLLRWFGGRSAVRTEALPGSVVMSVALVQAQRHRLFMRLKIVQDSRVGDALAGIAVGGLSAQSLDVGSATSTARVISGGSSSTVTTDDITVTRTTGATSATDYTWVWTPAAYNLNAVNVTRSSSNDNVIRPDAANPYLWVYRGTGTATLKLTTASASYTANVTTSTATGATVDTWQQNVAGSLRDHLEDTVDDLLAGKTATATLPVYSSQNHVAGTYVRNASNWAAGVDLTPISPWNSTGANHHAGTLISPRHVLFATHYQPAVGCTMRFVTADNTVVTRTLTGRQSLTQSASHYPDLTVGLLDSDVPGTIGFCRVLPNDWADYLPTLATRGVPCVYTDQEEKLLVSDLVSLTGGAGGMAQMRVPADPTRRQWYEDLVSGDSGNPACLVIDNQLVLLTVWTYGGAGSGTSVASFKTAVNSAMTSLGGGYTLTDADLSGFTDFEP